MTNDVAAVAFVGDNADGVVAESRLAEALGGWGGSRGGIGDRRGATTAGTKGAASSLKLSLCIWAIKTRWNGQWILWGVNLQFYVRFVHGADHHKFIKMVFVSFISNFINKAA